MAKITLNGVYKLFGEVRAVDDVSLEVADGEFLVLVGPSGCGKTTTLRMIAGFERPTYGTIAIGERVVNRISPKDRNLAMVFQSYALYPHMTVAKNLSFGMRVRRSPRGEIERRTRLNPADFIILDSAASPACAPSAKPTSCDLDAGVHSIVDAP